MNELKTKIDEIVSSGKCMGLIRAAVLWRLSVRM